MVVIDPIVVALAAATLVATVVAWSRHLVFRYALYRSSGSAQTLQVEVQNPEWVAESDAKPAVSSPQ